MVHTRNLFILMLTDVHFYFNDFGINVMQIKKAGQTWDSTADDYQPEEIPTLTENSSDKENKSEVVPPPEPKIEKQDSIVVPDQVTQTVTEETVQDDNSDEGWQEAIPKGRSPAARKSLNSRRPSLAKINTNFMNVSQSSSSSSRYRGKPGNFVSPRAGPSEPTAPKKFVKSASFSPKPNNTPSWTEKVSNPKSAPVTPAMEQVMKSSPISVQSAGKLFSYKEVALAPPGSIVKAVAEQLPKENVRTEEKLVKAASSKDDKGSLQTEQSSGEVVASESDPGTRTSSVIDYDIVFLMNTRHTRFSYNNI